MGAVVVRRALVLLVAATIAVMMTMGTALAVGSSGGGAGGGGGGGAGGAGGAGGTIDKQNNKVYVCHNWKTHYVSKKQARYWVNNWKYDYYGPCAYYYR